MFNFAGKILLNMSDFLIFVKVPDYEREWCEHHFGKPCTFPAQSNLNNVIRHFLKLRPKDAVPRLQEKDEIAIHIPFSKAKNPESYNYMTRHGKEAVAEAINDLFTMHMWEDLTGPGCRGVQVSKLILDWMLSNGIHEDNYHNLRQKFTRIKESYRKNSGMNISRGYKHENNKKG